MFHPAIRETHYAVGCGVLGTDVHHIFVVAEELRFLVLSVPSGFSSSSVVVSIVSSLSMRSGFCASGSSSLHRMPYQSLRR